MVIDSLYGLTDRPSKLSLPSADFTVEQGLRIVKQCLPIRPQICYSDIHQRLLFILIANMHVDDELKAHVMLELISFLEDMSWDNSLWQQSFESGFAVQFISKLLPVVEEENKLAVGTFVVHKLTEFHQALHSEYNVSTLVYAHGAYQQLLTIFISKPKRMI